MEVEHLVVYRPEEDLESVHCYVRPATCPCHQPCWRMVAFRAVESYLHCKSFLRKWLGHVEGGKQTELKPPSLVEERLLIPHPFDASSAGRASDRTLSW